MEYKWSLSSDPFPEWSENDWSQDAVKTKMQSLHGQLRFVTDFVRQLDINMGKKVVKNDFTRATQEINKQVQDGQRASAWQIQQAEEESNKKLTALQEQIEALQNEVKEGQQKLETVAGERAILQRGTLEIVKKRVLEDLKKEVHIEANKADIADYVENAVAKRMDGVKDKMSKALSMMQPDPSNMTAAQRLRRRIAKSHGIGSWRISELWKQMSDPDYKPRELSPEEQKQMQEQEEMDEKAEETEKAQTLLLDQLVRDTSQMSTEIEFLKGEIASVREYASGSALHAQEELGNLQRDVSVDLRQLSDKLVANLDKHKGDIATFKKESWDALSVLKIETSEHVDRISNLELGMKEMELRVKQGLDATAKEGRSLQRVLDSHMEEFRFDVTRNQNTMVDAVKARVKALEDKSLRTDSSYWEFHEKQKAAVMEVEAHLRSLEAWKAELDAQEDPMVEILTLSKRYTALDESISDWRKEVNDTQGRVGALDARCTELDQRLTDLIENPTLVSRDGSSSRLNESRPASAASSHRRMNASASQEFGLSFSMDGGLNASAQDGDGNPIQISSLQELYIALEEEIQSEANKRAVAFGDILRVLIPFRKAVLAELASKTSWQDVESLVRQLVAGGGVAGDPDDVIYQWQQTQGTHDPNRWSNEPRSWSRCSARSQDPVDSLYSIDLPRVQTSVRPGSSAGSRRPPSASGRKPPSARSGGAGGHTPRPPPSRSASQGSLGSRTARPVSAPGSRAPSGIATSHNTSDQYLEHSLTITSGLSNSSFGDGTRPATASYLPK